MRKEIQQQIDEICLKIYNEKKTNHLFVAKSAKLMCLLNEQMQCLICQKPSEYGYLIKLITKIPYPIERMNGWVCTSCCAGTNIKPLLENEEDE